LAAVLNTTKKRAKELVANFNAGDLGFFQTYFDGLKSVKFETGTVADGSVNLTLFVEENSLGAGASGVIRKNKGKPYVYKSMVDNWSPERRIFYLRSIFREAVVQTLLQSDKSYGKYVCMLSAIYRDGNNCVFQLEPLGIDLARYLATTGDPKVVCPILVRLMEVISYFKTTYRFSHNDLKLNNVMTVKEGNTVGNLKLIDFGLSSVRIGTVELGKPSQSKPDMYYLFHNLKMELEGKAYGSNNVDEALLASDLFKAAESLSELPAETPIQNYIDVIKGLKKGGSRRTRRTKR
jgi:serine/threonine protein kinase